MEMIQEKLKAYPYAALPDDFIPPLKTMKVTEGDPHPLEDRFQYLKALDKRPIPQHGTPIGGLSLRAFETRLDLLRRATKKWGEARIENYFVKELKREFPELRLNGRVIASTDDFAEWVQKPAWDAKKKGVVAFATAGMWGDNNQCCINFEQEYMHLIHAKFTGYKSNGDKAKRIHKGKCATTIFVRSKGSVVQKIRNWCKRTWYEGLYARNEKPPVFASLATPNKSGVPRLVKQFPVRLEDGHGFIGIVGICEGHPSLKAESERPASVILANAASLTGDGIMSPVTASLSSAEKSSPPTEAQKWLLAQSQVNSFEDLVNAIAKAQAEKTVTPVVQSPAPRENAVSEGNITS